MKRIILISFLLIISILMMLSCGNSAKVDGTNTAGLTKEQKEKLANISEKEQELEKRQKKLEEKEQELQKIEEEKKQAKLKKEEEERLEKEKEEQEYKSLVSDEEKTSDVISVKRMTPEKIVNVKIPKKNVIVKINQIENKEFPIVRLFVSVTDNEGNPLELENPNLFVIEENGQSINRSEIKEIIQQSQARDNNLIPLSAVLSIDKSGSMALNADETTKLPEEEQPLFFAKSAAVEFLDKIQSYDNVEFVTFDHNIQSLGKNFEALEKISVIQASGHTALYGALYTSVKTLEDKDGIKAVILLTDGKNDVERVPKDNKLSHISLEKGLELADKLSVPVFTIGLGKGVDTKGLKRIADETHATYFTTGNKEEISLLYERIRNIINNQYIISYNTKFLTDNTEVMVDLFGPNDTRVYQNSEELVKKEKEYQEKITNLDEQKEEYDTKFKQIERKETRLNEKEDQLNKREEKLNDKEKVLEKTKVELEEKKKALAKKDEELKKLEEQLASLDSQLDDKDQRLSELQDKLSTRESTLNNKKKELDDKEKELSVLRTSLEEREQQLNELNTSLNTRETKLNTKERELNNLKTTLDTRETELNNLNNELEKKETELDNFEKSLSDKSKTLDQREKELNELKEQLEKLEDELEKERERLKKVKEDLAALLSTMEEEVDDVNP